MVTVPEISTSPANTVSPPELPHPLAPGSMWVTMPSRFGYDVKISFLVYPLRGGDRLTI